MEKLSTPIELLGHTKNGIKIYYDREDSHASTHFADTAGLKKHVWEIIPKLEILKTYEDFVSTLDMGRVVGKSDLVENQPGDEIIYAVRLKRDKYAPFNKSQKPRPSSEVTIVIKPHEDDPKKMILHTAWVGPLTPSLPGAEDEMPNSRKFWKEHSLAFGNQEIDPDTITQECPWLES